MVVVRCIDRLHFDAPADANREPQLIFQSWSIVDVQLFCH